MPERLHVLVQGRVQGVGFRYATREAARKASLTGWVKNLPDGRVEAEFDGPRPDLEAILNWCHQGPAFARVDDVRATWSDSDEGHTKFQVRG
jgi:acylphosphatase